MQGEAVVSELVLMGGETCARLRCAPGLVPGPGQYSLVHAGGSQAPLATVLFPSRLASDGFITAAPIPSTWLPGTRLHLRSPLGRGFQLPAEARRVALVAYGLAPGTLLALLEPALRQRASVTLIASGTPDDLPLQVEVQPLDALPEVCRWADYVALDVPRESLGELRAALHKQRMNLRAEGQVLVRVPMPCGALAACGVCTVVMRGKEYLACEDGPVFDLAQVLEWSSKA